MVIIATTVLMEKARRDLLRNLLQKDLNGMKK